MTLKVVLEQGEDGWVVAHVPALRGCVSQGRTREEALANIKEYDEKSYCLLSTNFFEVRDQFPRLTSESIPEGVEKVTYSLSLDALAPFATDLTFPIHSQERFVQ